MPVLDLVRNIFRKGDPPAPPIINYPLPRGNKPEVTVRFVSTIGGASIGGGRDYETLATQGYHANSDVYACISLIAQAGKQVKWDTSAGTKSAKSLILLAKSGGANFIEHWLSFLLLAGNDYIEVGRNGEGTPVALYLLQPDRVSARTNLNTPDAEYSRQPYVSLWRVRDAKGNPYPVAPADMVHSKLFNPLDPIVGMAPLEAAMLHVNAENQGAELIHRLLERGYSPGWIEAAKDSIWEDTQVAQLKERMRSTKRSGEELFLENATYHEMGFTPIDSGVAQQQVLSKRDIASVFHVPPQLIGDTQSQTYSNYQEARRALYMEAVVPLLAQFRDDWNRTIGRDLDSPLVFDKDSFDAIAQARAEATERVHKLFTAGVITQNEARRDLEYDPVAGGDVFYAPASFLPLASGESEAS